MLKVYLRLKQMASGYHLVAIGTWVLASQRKAIPGLLHLGGVQLGSLYGRGRWTPWQQVCRDPDALPVFVHLNNDYGVKQKQEMWG